MFTVEPEASSSLAVCAVWDEGKSDLGIRAPTHMGCVRAALLLFTGRGREGMGGGGGGVERRARQSEGNRRGGGSL